MRSTASPAPAGAGVFAAADRWVATQVASIAQVYRDAGTLGLAGLAAGSFAYFVSALLLHDPLVWPDEALFANPVVNLLRHGHLGTDLMGGYLPGIETRTYWMPPLYYLALAPVFAIFGVSVTAMRVFSACTAAAVLALTYAVGRRAGCSRAAACTAVVLLAVDAVFLRAARIGRMDMLAVALTLGALHQSLGPSPARARSTIVAGALAGLAAITHPLGVVAPIAIALYHLIFPTAPRRRLLLCFAAGALVPALGWGLYVLGDPPAFIAQFGAQLSRKVERPLLSFDFLRQGWEFIINQYNDSGDLSLVDPRPAARSVWLLGTLGIAIGAMRRPAMRLLAMAHAVAFAIVLFAREMWYPIYVLPTIVLGVAALMGPALELVPGRRLVVVTVVAAVMAFVASNVGYEEGLHSRRSSSAERADYGAFCDDVERLIPQRSRVFVSIFPDLYLCLARRTDLTFRSFVPEQVPVSPETYSRVINESDIIVSGRWNPGGPADLIAGERGELIAEVGSRRGYAYHASVYRLPKATREHLH